MEKVFWLMWLADVVGKKVQYLDEGAWKTWKWDTPPSFNCPTDVFRIAPELDVRRGRVSLRQAESGPPIVYYNAMSDNSNVEFTFEDGKLVDSKVLV